MRRCLDPWHVCTSPLHATQPCDGAWGTCVACVSRVIASRTSAVKSTAWEPAIRSSLRAYHTAITPVVGHGIEPRRQHHQAVCAPRRRCYRTRDGYGSLCPSCVGGVPCLSSAWSPHPTSAAPEAGPPAGGTRPDGALSARRPGRAAACCWDSTSGEQRGVSRWLDTSWRRGGLPGC